MPDSILHLLVFAAALGSALVGGMFYAFSSFVMRALAQLPAGQGVAAMNSINRVVITPSFMLVFLGTALLCAGLATVAVLRWQGAASVLVLLASLLYALGCFGLTMVLNQPMNLKLAALPAAQAEAWWPAYVRGWTTWNHVRTAAAVVAAVLFVAALPSLRQG